MSSAIKCPKCKQRISISGNEQFLICPMCKTQIGPSEPVSTSESIENRPPARPPIQSTNPQTMGGLPSIGHPPGSPGVADQHHSAIAPMDDRQRDQQNFGATLPSTGQQSRDRNFSESNFDTPESGGSLMFAFFLIGAFALFLAVAGFLIWMLIRSL
ncbi:MAG: hypothetical protein AB8B55_06625 [Mariniblastus sp.]